MKIRQIEAFQAVMLTGSVTRAAERMNISQPAVSQLLGQLERAYRFRLFDRRAGKIIPTREAEALYTEVRKVFIGVDRIDRVAEAIREQSWGSLRIAAFPAISRRIIPEMILSFRGNHPLTRFHVQSMRARSIIDAVATHQVDLGISSIPGDRPEVESVYVHAMRAICLVPAGHRLSSAASVHAKDLEGETFVSLGFQDNSKNILDPIFDRIGVTRNITIECGQSEVIYSFIAGNAGISVIDPLCVYNVNGLNDERVKVLQFVPTIEWGVWIIRPQSNRPFNLVENFERFITDSLVEKIVELNEMMAQHYNGQHTVK